MRLSSSSFGDFSVCSEEEEGDSLKRVMGPRECEFWSYCKSAKDLLRPVLELGLLFGIGLVSGKELV